MVQEIIPGHRLIVDFLVGAPTSHEVDASRQHITVVAILVLGPSIMFTSVAVSPGGALLICVILKDTPTTSRKAHVLL